MSVLGLVIGEQLFERVPRARRAHYNGAILDHDIDGGASAQTGVGDDGLRQSEGEAIAPPSDRG
jgi:hypothetical protein